MKTCVADGIEFYDRKQEQALQIFADTFDKDVKVLAKTYIELFFRDKTLHCGGKIPKSFLLSEKRIDRVLNYDISTGVQMAYKNLEPTITQEEILDCHRNGEISRDIKMVTEVLNLLARSGVPQQFAGGMMILYLEFVEGVRID
jgi:hypothetical protein